MCGKRSYSRYRKAESTITEKIAACTFFPECIANVMWKLLNKVDLRATNDEKF